MKSGRTFLAVTAALAVAAALPIAGRADDKGNDKDNKPPENVIVDFGSPQPQPAPAQLSHELVPNEVTIQKRGTVTFRVNGGGHGVAIYPVSENTTRAGITAQLCTHDPVTHLCTDTTFSAGDHTIVDGEGNVIIVSGTNPPFLRLDDPTDRLLATSTQIGAVAGAFLTGTNAAGGAGNQIQFRFTREGRFLVICMNRNHSLNDWMFGFVNVGDDDDN